MKIVFAGTPEFASKHLEMILKSEHEIVGVMTQPDRKSGRGKKIHFSPVKQLAELERLNLLQPSNLKNDEFIESFTALEPDLFLVVAYGLIIPKQILKIPNLDSINVHASILPRWRGASPMEYAILNGDNKTGISYMRMNEGLDEGPIYEIHECEISLSDGLEEIENKLISLSDQYLINFLDRISEDNMSPTSQPETGITFAPKIGKDLLSIRWDKDRAEEIVKKINALGTKYGTYTFLGRDRVKIIKATVGKTKLREQPGCVNFSDRKLIVSCEDFTSIEISHIQMQGKKIVTGSEFFSAYKNTLAKNNNLFTAE